MRAAPNVRWRQVGRDSGRWPSGTARGVGSVLGDPDQEIKSSPQNGVQIGGGKRSSVEGLPNEMGHERGTKMKQFIGQPVKPRSGIAKAKKNGN